jgi:hypothetical protein
MPLLVQVLKSTLSVHRKLPGQNALFGDANATQAVWLFTRSYRNPRAVVVEQLRLKEHPTAEC